MKSGIDSLCQDLRFGFQTLWKNPGFSAVIVITLALGIGANCAIFSLVYAAVLRPLPFPQVNRLVFVSTGKGQAGPFNSGVSGLELEEWKPQLGRVFEEFAAVGGNHETTWDSSGTVAGQGVHLANRDVSDNFFPMLGVHPFAGRTFTREDTAQGHGDVVVLSYDFWQRHFGGDLRAMGRPMRKKGGAYASYTVIGILPPSFEFDQTTDVWTPQQPLSADPMNLRVARRFRVIGRLKPEIRLQQAQAAMNTLAAQEAQSYPASNRGWEIRVAPLTEHFQANGHLALLLLWVAVGCLLLISCANAANLLLARSGARENEIAVRLALGASRGRLMAQLLTESGLLAPIGGGFGWLLAAGSLRLLRFWGSFVLPISTLQDVMRWRADLLDPGVVAFTLLASILSVAAFGLAPAWRSTGLELNPALQGSSGNRNTRRLGISQMLVTAEVAMAMVLVMSSGLLIRSFVRLTAVDPGFRAENRLTFDVELPSPLEIAASRHPLTPAENRQRWQRQTLWFEELERRLQSVPGIQAVGASNAFPLTEEAGGWGVEIEGKQLPSSTSMAHVSSGYFDAMGAPVVEGSNFGPATDSIPGSKALIVNQTMAHLLFPGGDAVGKHVNAPRCQIDISSNSPPSGCVIVGIAKDTRFSLDSLPPPTFYYSLHQDVGDRVTYVARVSHNPAGLVPVVRNVVLNMPPIDSSKAYFFHLQTVDQMVAQSVATPRFRSWLVSLFAGLALLLAAVGIYGVQAYAVSRRTREIGIRMALGAKPASLFAMILSQAAGWTLLGVGVGLSAGLATTRLISGFLFEVRRWDPVTLAISALVLVGVALLASYVPARRAMRVDPMVALRRE
jgi:putative ABC transport system permease protein